MIFASDLDRTLIYSKKALDEFGGSDEAKLQPVEFKDGKAVAYMTEKAILLLKNLSEKVQFVPVTTRTTEQFERFVLFKKEILLTYVITFNGAEILYKGKPLVDWSKQISVNLEQESAAPEDIRGLLIKENMVPDGQFKQAGCFFFYYILNRIASKSSLLKLKTILAPFGWRISLQGRKLYFIPLAINKGAALKYVCRHAGMEALVGAGDSNLDWDFLQYCCYRIIPSHGESEKFTGKYYLTRNKGIIAGEEILALLHGLVTLETSPF